MYRDKLQEKYLISSIEPSIYNIHSEVSEKKETEKKAGKLFSKTMTMQVRRHGLSTKGLNPFLVKRSIKRKT